MRLRVAVAIVLTVVAYFAIAFTWRQVFPFRDGLADFLPEGTIAYVHVNLTPAIRRALQAQLESFLPATAAPEKDGRIFLEQALDALDVREFAFVWHRPEKLAPQLAFIIGQRASKRPDVVPAATFAIGGQEVRVFVVRIRTNVGNPPLPLSFPLPSSGGEGEKVKKRLRRHPVQVMLRPRVLPIPALEAARHLLPGAITASGTLSRHGLILRGDQKNAIAENWSHRIPLIVRSTRIELLAEPRSGTFQIIGLPVRAIAEQLDLPFHGELRAAIEPFLPERADLLMEGDRVAVRMPAPAIQLPETILRSLAARIWLATRRRLLDGLLTEVLVADPDAFEISQTGPDHWVLRSRGGEARIFAERSGDFVYLATDATLIGSALPTPSRSPSGRGGESGGARLRIPSACRLDGQSALIVWQAHPQAAVTMSVDLSGSNVAFCGRIAQPES